jgi:hypothetical protein
MKSFLFLIFSFKCGERKDKDHRLKHTKETKKESERGKERRRGR